LSNEITTTEQEKPKMTPEEYQVILQGLSLAHIHLRECKFSAKPETMGTDTALKVLWEAEASFQDLGDGLIIIDHRYDLKGRSKNADVVKVRAQYRVALLSKEPFTEEFFNIYKRNLLLHTWPYLRELVSSMTARAGLTQFTLPMSVVR